MASRAFRRATLSFLEARHATTVAKPKAAARASCRLRRAATALPGGPSSASISVNQRVGAAVARSLGWSALKPSGTDRGNKTGPLRDVERKLLPVQYSRNLYLTGTSAFGYEARLLWRGERV